MKNEFFDLLWIWNFFYQGEFYSTTKKSTWKWFKVLQSQLDLEIEERTQEINSFHSSLSHPFHWRRRQKREFDNENKQLSFRYVSFLLRQTNNWTIFFSLRFSAVFLLLLLLLLCRMLILEFDCLKQSGYLRYCYNCFCIRMNVEMKWE